MKKAFQLSKKTIILKNNSPKLAFIVFCQGEETEDLTILLNSLDQEDSCGRILITTNINSKEDGCRTTFETNAIGKEARAANRDRTTLVINNSCYC